MKLDINNVFQGQRKLWVQVGPHLNIMDVPSDVGLVAFEPEFRTAKILSQTPKENVIIIPAAVSNKGGVAVFGAGINEGKSSSLNVTAHFPLRRLLKFLVIIKFVFRR